MLLKQPIRNMVLAKEEVGNAEQFEFKKSIKHAHSIRALSSDGDYPGGTNQT
jgi:hypothetical protein